MDAAVEKLSGGCNGVECISKGTMVGMLLATMVESELSLGMGMLSPVTTVDHGKCCRCIAF